MAAPIKNTCPDIDRLISDMESLADNATKELEDIYETVHGNIVNEVSNFRNALEELRYANGTLRDWGESLEKQINDLENEHQSELERKESEIESLAETITDLQNQIDELSEN